jgi:hypothetical protein
MFEPITIKAVTRHINRRPKIFERGMMMKFAQPRVMTQTPRKRDTVAGVAPKYLMKIGVTGAMDNAGIIEKITNKD